MRYVGGRWWWVVGPCVRRKTHGDRLPELIEWRPVTIGWRYRQNDAVLDTQPGRSKPRDARPVLDANCPGEGAPSGTVARVPERRFANAVDTPHVGLRTHAGRIPHVNRGLAKELQACWAFPAEKMCGRTHWEEHGERMRRGVEREVEGDLLCDGEYACGGQVKLDGDALYAARALRFNEGVVALPFWHGPKAVPEEGKSVRKRVRWSRSRVIEKRRGDGNGPRADTEEAGFDKGKIRPRWRAV